MIVKEKMSGRTLEVKENEKKKLEILLFAGWTVVSGEAEVLKPEVHDPDGELLVVTPVVEPEVTKAVAVVENEFLEPHPISLTDDDDQTDGDTPEFPEPATEPRKARQQTPKIKKTLKLPNDYA